MNNVEDYIPKLKAIGELITTIDPELMDAQEMDYLDEINDYCEYLVDKYSGAKVKTPDTFFIGR
jgi:hypothetical protein